MIFSIQYCIQGLCNSGFILYCGLDIFWIGFIFVTDKNWFYLASICILNNGNICIALGIFPYILKTSKITPIYKKDNKELIENYRPVSTLPIFGKIFGKIIYSPYTNF